MKRSGILILTLIALVSIGPLLIAHSQNQRELTPLPGQRDTSEEKPSAGRADRSTFTHQERFVRSAYKKLERYNAAFNHEAALSTETAYEPALDIAFQLSNFHSGPVSEIGNTDHIDTTGRSDSVILVSPNYVALSGDPTFATYSARWAGPSSSAAKSKTSIRETTQSISATGAQVRGLTTYDVVVKLAGKTLNYRAFAVQYIAGGQAATRIVDNVVPAIDAIGNENSPIARAPWSRFVKSATYLAIVRSINDSSAGQNIFESDMPVGFLPGDGIQPEAHDVRLAQQAISPAAVPCEAGEAQLSAAQTILDGQTASFSVTIISGTATGYTWSYTAPSNAGNNPNVTFSPANSQGTTTNGHWFALPNDPCLAGQNSTYTVSSRVTFSDGTTRTPTSTLTVTLLSNPAVTNAPTITGGPTIGFDTARNLWVLTSTGTLARTQPTVNIFIPSSSQFYQKAAAHENKHVQQWQSGLLSDLFTVAGLWQAISGLTDATQSGLQTKVNSAAAAWFQQQANLFSQRRVTAEREAYVVSDPMAPRYFYQNCGRF